MANARYPLGMKALMDGSIPFLSADLKIVALSSAYSYNAAHDHYDDLTGVIAVSPNLSGKTTTGGVFDCADLTPAFTSVTTNIASLVLFRDTGVPSTSQLISFVDTATGLPYTQNGGNVNVAVHASGLLSIA